jgi:hypothetical protein
MVLLLFVIYNLFCLRVGGARDEDEYNGENDDSEESEEEGFRFTAEKAKLLLDAYKKFQRKIMSGRQKKDKNSFSEIFLVSRRSQKIKTGRIRDFYERE